MFPCFVSATNNLIGSEICVANLTDLQLVIYWLKLIDNLEISKQATYDKGLSLKNWAGIH